MQDTDEIDQLVKRSCDGDQSAFAELIGPHTERLKRFVQLRMDQRLTRRLDAMDIVQEATMEAYRRLETYAANPPCRFFLWLRTLTAQKLIDAHRHHLGTQKRGGAQEVSIFRGPMPEASSVMLANQLMGRLTSPSRQLHRAEVQLQVQKAMNALDPIDREVLVMRHFEHLSNDETAEALDLKKTTASKRYTTALRRLGEALAGSEESDLRL
jgi:RNA polymerase sigma-70 factor (ECF subfamily)